MRVRTVAALSLAAVAAAGSLTPALAAKPTPKPIVMTYTANATPDPSPAAGEICQPVTPTARHTTAFKVPAAGTLKMELMNTLDWAGAIRQGGKTLGSADAGTPEVRETVQVKMKKAGMVELDACNFAGEPSIQVKVTFTYK